MLRRLRCYALAALDALSPDTVLSEEHAKGALARVLPDSASGSQRNRRVFERGLDLLLGGISARIAALGDTDIH